MDIVGICVELAFLVSPATGQDLSTVVVCPGDDGATPHGLACAHQLCRQGLVVLCGIVNQRGPELARYHHS